MIDRIYRRHQLTGTLTILVVKEMHLDLMGWD